MKKSKNQKPVTVGQIKKAIPARSIEFGPENNRRSYNFRMPCGEAILNLCN